MTIRNRKPLIALIENTWPRCNCACMSGVPSMRCAISDVLRLKPLRR